MGPLVSRDLSSVIAASSWVFMYHSSPAFISMSVSIRRMLFDRWPLMSPLLFATPSKRLLCRSDQSPGWSSPGTYRGDSLRSVALSMTLPSAAFRRVSLYRLSSRP